MTITYGIIAATTPSDTNEATLYTAGTGESVVALLTASNSDTSGQTYTVKVTKSGGSDIPKGTNVELMPTVIPDTYLIALNAGDAVKVTSGSANNISFVLEGAIKT